MEGDIWHPQGPGLLEPGSWTASWEGSLLSSLQTVAYGARGSSECLWARKGCGGRADEPTSIPTLFRSRTAFIYVGVLVKFHLKNVPSC